MPPLSMLARTKLAHVLDQVNCTARSDAWLVRAGALGLTTEEAKVYEEEVDAREAQQQQTELAGRRGSAASATTSRSSRATGGGGGARSARPTTLRMCPCVRSGCCLRVPPLTLAASALPSSF